MADEIVPTPVNAPEGVSPELHQMMQASLTGKAPETIVNDNGGGQIAAPLTDTPPAPIPFSFDTIKEKYGFEKPEDFFTEIDGWKTKATTTAPAPEPLKFENPTSESVFKALQAGKFNEVYSVLDQQNKLDRLTSLEVNKDTASEIIKLGMQLKYKNLSPEEIDFQYKEEYSIPKEPVFNELKETQDEFDEKHAAWKEQAYRIEMKRTIQAKQLIPELENAKAQLKFPEISSQQDEGYIQYKKSLEQQTQAEAEMKEIFKPFTPVTIQTKMPFNDETNKIAFEFQYQPDEKSFSRSVEVATNPEKFLAHFSSSNGEFDNAAFLKAIDVALNYDSYLMAAMTQAKNATIKSSLPDNSGNGMNRQPITPAAEPTELDKQMRMALDPYQRNGRQLVTN